MKNYLSSTFFWVAIFLLSKPVIAQLPFAHIDASHQETEEVKPSSTKGQDSTSYRSNSLLSKSNSDGPQKNSLFDHLYQLEEMPKIKITTNINRLIRKKLQEVYQDAKVEFSNQSENEILTLSGRIRARGNMRKKVNFLPPVKLDFKKRNLDSLGFLTSDRLKLVFPSDAYPYNQELLFKEFLLYQIYAMIDSNAIRTKLVDISILWKGIKKYQFKGFLIEDEKEYKRRKKLHIVRKGILNASALDRESFLKMVFFQYMIANTDWSIGAKHNLEMVKFPDIDRVVAMPYDFDYSGFVGQRYAIPNPTLPITSVHERYFFRPYKIKKEEYIRMVDYYLSIEQTIYELCDKASYMKTKTIKKNKAYLKKFFDLLRNAEKLMPTMVK